MSHGPLKPESTTDRESVGTVSVGWPGLDGSPVPAVCDEQAPRRATATGSTKLVAENEGILDDTTPRTVSCRVRRT